MPWAGPWDGLGASRAMGEVSGVFHALSGKAYREAQSQNPHACMSLTSKSKTRIARMNVKSAQSVLSLKSFAFRIFIVALVLRLIPVILARGLGIGLDDMFQYDMLARSLAAGNGFRWYAQEDLNQLAAFVDFDLSSVKEYDPTLGIPTSFRAPLYPTFLAIIYFFNGTDFSRFFAARLAQAIFLGAPLAPLTYWVAQRLFPLSSFLKDESQ